MKHSNPVFIKTAFVLFLSVNLAYAQVTPPNNSSTYHLNTDNGKSLDIRERLVLLALQNPNYEIADRMIAIADYNIRLAKGTWLSTLVAQGNLNEFSINPKAGTNAVYYPRYNFGLTIPFDIVSKNTNNIKIARENYQIALAQKNERYREIKAEVLTKYEDYLLAKQKLELQTQITQDEFALYKKSEKEFDDNIIKLEDFNRSSAAWVSAQIIKLDDQRNLNVTKIELERMIGIRLEEVFQQVK
jgi:outer membrane protein TolC